MFGFGRSWGCHHCLGLMRDALTLTLSRRERGFLVFGFGSARRLWREQNFAGGLPAFHSAVRLLCLGEGEFEAHVELDLSALDPV